MGRDTSFDTLTYDLLVAFVHVESALSGLGSVPLHDGVTTATYPHLGLPLIQEPFPAIYNYIGGVQPDYSQGSSIRNDVVTVVSRLIGGPVTPAYKVNPEDAANKLVTAFLNEFDYRPFLQDPTNNNASFRYLSAVGERSRSVGRTTAFNYGEKGSFVGIEIFSIVTLQVNMGRLS